MKTQFSRRELYAMGEPLGESATRVVAGRRIYGGGGGVIGDAVSSVFGGGGSNNGGSFSSSSPANPAKPTVNPMTQTDAQQGIAGYAQPYVNTMLGSTMQNLFDYDASGNATGMKQYNPYSYNPADYVAGFSPLQQQVQQGAANMQMPGQFGMATGAANLGTQQALNAGNQYAQQATNPNAMQAYMSPYIQNALQPQLQEMQRQYDITGAQEAGKATGAGAFGGSRQALMQAENQRNKNMAMNQAIGTGFQNAFTNAQQAQQYGAGLGLQGAQAGIQGANSLGNLGTSQLGAQQSIYGLQNALGQQQQQQQQDIINRGVQNYETAQQYPMQQLGQMKNMLSGLPITTTSTQNYQAAPTNLQNIMALGMGGYGLNQLMGGGSGGSGGGGGITGLLNGGASGLGNLVSGAGSLIGQGWDAVKGYLPFEEGGQVKSYAKGGVTSEENVRSIADFLPTPQLPKSFQMAQGRGDFNAQDALQQEMAERASLQRGLGGAFNQLPQGAQQNVIRAAGGGVIAFNGDEEENDPRTGQMVSEVTADNIPSAGNPRLQGVYGNKLLDLVTRMEKDTGPTLMTPGEVSVAEEAAFNRMQKRAGPAPYDMLKKQLTQDEAARGETLAQGKGLAALQAMSGMLQPGGAMRGLGAAGSAFASSYGDALKADKAEKRYIGQMQFNLADAERKERMGLHKEARADVQSAQQNQINAYKAKNLKDQAMGNILGKGMQATRTTGSGAGGAGKTPKIAEQNYLNILEDLRATSKPKDGESPKAFEARIARQASELAVAQSKDIGPNKVNIANDALTIKLKAAESADLEKLSRNPDYREATPAMKQLMEDKVRAETKRRVTLEDANPAPGNAGGNDYSHLWGGKP